MHSYSQRFNDKIYSIKEQIPVYMGAKFLKIHQKSKYVYEVMLSKSDKARSNMQVFDNINWK